MEFPKSPDGGWGWVIVAVSFFTQFLCYGSPLAVGVLYIEWLDAFGEGKGKTAWVGSLASGVGLLASKWLCLCVFLLFNPSIALAILSAWHGARRAFAHLKPQVYFPARHRRDVAAVPWL